jgi:hypothetical protein
MLAVNQQMRGLFGRILFQYFNVIRLVLPDYMKAVWANAGNISVEPASGNVPAVFFLIYLKNTSLPGFG